MAELIHRRTFHAPIATAFFAPPPAPPTADELRERHRLAFITPKVVVGIAATGIAKPDVTSFLASLCTGYQPTPFPWRLGRFNLGG